MEKIDYQTPAMKIVELKSKMALLAGSGDEGSMPEGGGLAPELEFDN